MSQLPEAVPSRNQQSFAEYENKKVQDSLNLLGIFFYVMSGVGAMFSMFPILHLVLGIVFIINPDGFNGPQQTDETEALFMGWFMVIFAATFILIGLTLSFLTFLTGRFMRARRNYTFCIVISAIICIHVPFGTILGVFSLVNLTKDSAKISFGQMEAKSEAPI